MPAIRTERPLGPVGYAHLPPGRACWCCGKLAVAGDYIAGLGLECAVCRSRIETPITELEIAAYGHFHRRAMLLRPEIRAQIEAGVSDMVAAGVVPDADAARGALMRAAFGSLSA